MRENIIRIYWQAMDANGRVFSYNIKPALGKDKDEYRLSEGGSLSNIILFPVLLKPLQIAEITVNGNGTWSYEIEREEGWYIVRSKKTAEITIWQYKLSKWHYRDGDDVTTNLRDVNISSTRIPDECII